MSKPFIVFENVAKVYRMGEVEIRAVNGADFTIDKGEFTVIVGPSGAGKTTILNMLGGMDSYTGGRIIVDDREVSRSSSRQRPVFLTWTVSMFPPYLTWAINRLGRSMNEARTMPGYCMIFPPFAGFSVGL